MICTNLDPASESMLSRMSWRGDSRERTDRKHARIPSSAICAFPAMLIRSSLLLARLGAPAINRDRRSWYAQGAALKNMDYT